MLAIEDFCILGIIGGRVVCLMVNLREEDLRNDSVPPPYYDNFLMYKFVTRESIRRRWRCENHDLQHDQSWIEKIIPGQMQSGLQSCCQELQNVEEQCQCEAVKEAFRQTQRMQQGGSFGAQQIRELKQKAQELPNQCRLQTRQCQVGPISVTTTATFTEETNPRGGSQMCQHIRGRQFNQCQSFIERQMGTLLMSVCVSRKGQETQGVEQCCNELLNVEEECQCEAMNEVYRQVQQMERQGSRQGGRQTQDMRQMVENLRNQCHLQVQQCRIPSAMF
ncbi:hypothetical protein LXL04_039833 [Taraxacum kok-saghyz]